ncbi:MAG: 8-amino-7-oxononanoate synthase [Planctomycetes bacterium]|nr:8-amino-7-oxononanoate synthase [Planctomycetota bacterium]
MVPDVWKRFLRDQRFQRDQLKLTRKLRSLRHLGSTKVQIGSHEFLNFSSNDYLGLTGDLRIAEAAASAAGRFGWGTAASRLVTGSSTQHTKLEGEIAAFRDTEAALLFGSGYQANLGVLTALAGPEDTILSDANNHASIVAGCKLSGAQTKVFKHCDYDDLERKLNGVKSGKIIVVTDSIFSIEGDAADLPRMVKLCERFNALLIVDDAHANACLGKKGRGVPELQNCMTGVPVVIANFSKALGSYGGFVACDEELREFLVNHSRPFIYTTAIPVALAAANLEALRIVRREGDALRLKLSSNTSLLRGRLAAAGFQLTGKHQIIGIHVGSPEQATHMANDIEFHGILVHPMRWPTVAEGRDCLRVSVTAAHTDEDIGRVVDAIKKSRDGLTRKKTDGLTRRQNKRPTHQQLDTSEMPLVDGFDDFDDHPDDGFMSAHDSSRLPPPDQVDEIASQSASASDTMIVNPEPVGGNDSPTRPVDKAGIEEEQEEEQEEAHEQESPETDDEPESGFPDVAGSEPGETLAPETAAELQDPVIADIEGGTKKRGRKSTARKKGD